MNEEFLKIEYFISLSQYLETILENVSLGDLMTAFARFPKYWLSFVRYSTLKSSLFMFCQNLIETLYVPVVIYIYRKSSPESLQW